MIIDFELKKEPAYRVATITRVGPWKEDNLRSEFGELTRWAKSQKVRSGKWIFREAGSNRWEACLQFQGKAEAGGRIRIKMLPPSRVAHVVFDPDQIADRIIYHGLSDWTRWRRKYGEIKEVVSVREVYSGDPWKDARAWKQCDVQFLVR